MLRQTVYIYGLLQYYKEKEYYSVKTNQVLNERYLSIIPPTRLSRLFHYTSHLMRHAYAPWPPAYMAGKCELRRTKEDRTLRAAVQVNSPRPLLSLVLSNVKHPPTHEELHSEGTPGYLWGKWADWSPLLYCINAAGLLILPIFADSYQMGQLRGFVGLDWFIPRTGSPVEATAMDVSSWYQSISVKAAQLCHDIHEHTYSTDR